MKKDELQMNEPVVSHANDAFASTLADTLSPRIVQTELDKSTLTEREKAYLNADTTINNITSYCTKLKKELYNNFGRKNETK